MDSAGANVAVWQAGTHIGAQRVNDPGCLCWNEHYSRDVSTAKAFYASVFGWTFNVDEANAGPMGAYATIMAGEQANGGMLQMGAEMGMPPCWVPYFTVADLDAAQTRLEAAGGRAVAPRYTTPVGPCLVSSDPQGGMFTLIQLSEIDP